MTGRESRKKVKGKRQKIGEATFNKSGFDRLPFSFFLFPFSFPRQRRGFTLLELMIVMFILIILVAVAMPQYQKWVLHAREAVLRDDLFQMRKLIDQYAADKGKLPQSLDELATGGYMREIPEDPMTGEKNWNVTLGEDPNSTEGGQGVTDVHSASTDISTDGRPYSEW